MKKILLSFLTLSVVLLSSCSKNDENEVNPSESNTIEVDATSSATWQYVSLAEQKVIGSGKESAEDNAIWAKRKDWDLAICRFMVRSNSGLSTSVNAQGGVHTFDESLSFESIKTLPSNPTFVVDKMYMEYFEKGMKQIIHSSAQVITFKKDKNGDRIMPPVFMHSPIYLFRSADGKSFYKVDFLRYKNADGVSGHVALEIGKMN